MAGTLTEQLDNLYATTFQKMGRTAADNIFDEIAFFFYLKSKGKIRNVSGGRFISEPVIFSNSATASWQAKGAVRDPADSEILTSTKRECI